MPPGQRQRVTSSSSTSSNPQQSPPRPPESQIEVLYNTAVQSFVRRDHVKAQAVLSRLLALLKQKQSQAIGKSVWYDFDNDSDLDVDADADKRNWEISQAMKEGGIDEWVTKTLKLSISSLTSLYTDPPTSSSTSTTLSSEIINLLPPSNPDKLLKHLLDLCQEHITLPIPNLLPPQVMSTLLLASLNLKPSDLALDFAHRLAEDWFTALPDQFIITISTPHTQSSSIPATRTRESAREFRKRRKIESARQGYLKVVEIFVGQVLSREGEWGMARGFLDGESVMGAKRKEVLFKHLRAMQSSPKPQITPDPSPSSSLVLPATSNPSSESNSRTISRASGSRSRSGSSSASSSSSERTARPNHTHQIGSNTYSSTATSNRVKGKSKETQDQGSLPGIDSGTRISRDIPRRTSQPISKSTSSSSSKISQIIRSTLPPPVSQYIDVLLESQFSYLFGIPIPLILILTLIIRRRRRNIRLSSTSLTPQTTLSMSSNINNIQEVRDKLRALRARDQGWVTWFKYYINWWIRKFIGVWNLGTTITYI